MKPRSIALPIAIALIVAVGIVALTAYPFSEKEHRPPEAAFAVGDTDEYRIAATVTVDGETVLAVDGTVAESGARYVRVVENDVTTERYQEETAAAAYTRQILDADAERRLRELEADADRTVIDEAWENGALTVVSVTDAAESEPDPTGAASVVATELRVAAYDDVDEAGSGRLHVLEPQSGWYNGSRSYRITGSSGKVRVDPETDVLYSADVRWELTPGTPSYAHYLLNRDEAITQAISYEYAAESVEVDPPDWVERTSADPRNGSNGD